MASRPLKYLRFFTDHIGSRAVFFGHLCGLSAICASLVQRESKSECALHLVDLELEMRRVKKKPQASYIVDENKKRLVDQGQWLKNLYGVLYLFVKLTQIQK
jgi:hypothetical protein